MKAEINFICNNSEIEASVHPGLSLLDFLRKELRLTGTKEGCREGDCGACTILIGEYIGKDIIYHSVNSCLLPIGDVFGKHVVTIEGLNNNELNAVQKSFVEEGASQCGFCTPGFIVSLTGYFLSNKKFNVNHAIESMDGNVCRCTGHFSIIKAAQSSTKFLSKISSGKNHLNDLMKVGIIPEYFSSIKERLGELKQKTALTQTDSTIKFIIAGGTDLFVQKWEDILDGKVNLLSSNGISNLIKEENRKCIIGARASVTDLIESKIIRKYLPSLTEKLKLFGSLPIRNRATIGGNIINASPIADITSILLALNSTLYLKQKKTERTLPLKDLYKGYKKLDLKKDELIDRISFPLPAENSYFSFEKVSKRTYLDIASVNSSVYLEVDKNQITEIHLSAGGVAPIPLYLKYSSEFLLGKEISSENIHEAVNIALSEIAPISDVRGSKEYKALLLRQLIFAHFITLFPEKVNIKEIA
ncbi:MAG: FAD binding domain-containing protein [Ignavibacteria bacterium]|nr:FAD binding domain-containing protein [Ignavibacteria bacterium]